MSTLYKRSDVYWIQYFIEGRKFLKTLKTKDEREAKRKQKDLDAKLQLRMVAPSSGKITIEAAFQAYMELKRPSLQNSTYVRYGQLIQNLKTFLQSHSVKYVNDLRNKHLSDFVAHRKSEKAAGKTIWEEVLALKATIKLLMSQKQLLTSPIQEWPVIKRTTAKPETIDRYTPAEISKLKEYFQNRPEYDYILMHIYTGCRRSEIWGITKADVNIEENSMRIQNFKTGTNVANQFRFIEIHSELKPVLLKHCVGKKSKDILFPKIGSGNWLMKAVFKACKKMELPYRRLHGFRHAFVSNLLLAGVPPRIVMSMAGHCNLATTLRYSHINLADVKGKIESLGY